MVTCNYEDVISNIKNVISDKRMKQKAVAEKAGFTPQEFSNILNYIFQYLSAISVFLRYDRGKECERRTVHERRRSKSTVRI